MAYHHIALATRDMEATHTFYTEAMGFELVKAVVAPTENAGGWAKHLFYDTGGDGLIAFWDLHDEVIGDFDPAISTGAGLPPWVNHVAFHSELDGLDEHRERWLGQGVDYMEIDHGFCVSIYAMDPNGILVEWCADTRALDETDRRDALDLLRDPAPALETPPVPTFHRAPRPVPAH